MGNRCSFSKPGSDQDITADVMDPSGSCPGIAGGTFHDDGEAEKKVESQTENAKTSKCIHQADGILGSSTGSNREPLALCDDSIVNSVIRQFVDRSNFGQLKYGTTLDRDDLTIQQWIQHMQEELMDAILYLEKIKTTAKVSGILKEEPTAEAADLIEYDAVIAPAKEDELLVPTKNVAFEHFI